MKHAHVNRSWKTFSQLFFSSFCTIFNSMDLNLYRKFDIDVDLDVYDDQMSIVSTGNEIN